MPFDCPSWETGLPGSLFGGIKKVDSAEPAMADRQSEKQEDGSGPWSWKLRRGMILAEAAVNIPMAHKIYSSVYRIPESEFESSRSYFYFIIFFFFSTHVCTMGHGHGHWRQRTKGSGGGDMIAVEPLAAMHGCQRGKDTRGGRVRVACAAVQSCLSVCMDEAWPQTKNLRSVSLGWEQVARKRRPRLVGHSFRPHQALLLSRPKRLFDGGKGEEAFSAPQYRYFFGRPLI